MNKIWKIHKEKGQRYSAVVGYNGIGRPIAKNPNVICVCDPDWGNLLAASVELPHLDYTGDSHWSVFQVPNVSVVYLCMGILDSDQFVFSAVMRGINVHSVAMHIDSRVRALAKKYGVDIERLDSA